MAVDVRSAALLSASLLAAALALWWPALEAALSRPPGGGAANATTRCPLGFEAGGPADHPPIAGGGAAPRAPAPAARLATYANARIWTADPDPDARWASSLTVDLASGRVVSLGRGGACAGGGGAGGCAGDAGGAVVIDLGGAFVMPGFVDAHVHLVPGGLSLSQIDLRGAASRREVAERVAAAAAAAPPGAWLLGTGWSEADWSEAEGGAVLPDASWIDEAAGGRPAFLSRMDTHMALVSSEALRLAGLDAPGAGAGVAGGTVDADPDTGRPTGLLREAGMGLVLAHVPPPSLEARRAALADAGRHLLSRGVTAVGDMGWGLWGAAENTWADLERVYDDAADAGGMPVRVSAYVPLRTWRRLAHRVAVRGDHHAASGRLSWGGVKEFADGSLGARSALMREPYLPEGADAPPGDAGARGARSIEAGELRALLRGAAGAGLQAAVHAIGDAAVDEVLDAFQALREDCGGGGEAGGGGGEPGSGGCGRGVAHRIEHVQHISGPGAAARLGALGLVGVPNPQHLLSDAALLLPLLGAERAGAGRSHAYGTLARGGARVAFASDWPVVPIDPWLSVHAAVHRAPPGTPPAGAPPPAPEERLPLEAVLLAHTAGGAAAARLDAWAGALTVGRRGDFILLDRDPFADGGSLSGGLPRVTATYMDGACPATAREQPERPPQRGRQRTRFVAAAARDRPLSQAGPRRGARGLARRAAAAAAAAAAAGGRAGGGGAMGKEGKNKPKKDKTKAKGQLPEPLETQRNYVLCGPAVNKHTATATSASQYLPLGVDNAWDFDAWSSSFEIKVRPPRRAAKPARAPAAAPRPPPAAPAAAGRRRAQVNSLSAERVEFDMLGADPALANALRRILIAEVPTVAIEHVFIVNNTSIIQDEVLSHRLGLVPLAIDPTRLEWRADGDGAANESNTVVFRLNVACRRAADGSVLNDKVYSRDLVWLPDGSELPDETGCCFSATQEGRFDAPPADVERNILLAKMRPGQCIELEAHAVKGTGQQHAKWSPVATAWYRLQPEVVLTREVAGDEAAGIAAAVPGLFTLERGRLVAGDARQHEDKLERVRRLLEHESWGDAVVLRKRKDHFIFTVESTGCVPAPTLFSNALTLLAEKCEKLAGRL
ncbi:LAF3 [Scenedesmus sp. PABB004]|nr:LAF3 [Scenedesmus sp. PABB004]